MILGGVLPLPPIVCFITVVIREGKLFLSKTWRSMKEHGPPSGKAREDRTEIIERVV